MNKAQIYLLNAGINDVVVSGGDDSDPENWKYLSDVMGEYHLSASQPLNTMEKINIPYNIEGNGFNWTLIGIGNNFARKDTFVFAEYENQYGHIKQLDRQHLTNAMRSDGQS